MYSVLIAEDELLVRMGLTISVPWDQLDMMVVAEASDGQQALEAWRKYRPDILITDLMMPGMDGLALIRQIQEEDKHCAVIVVTCMEQFGSLHEAMELGVAAYLVKATMRLEDIQSAVRKAKAALGPSRGDNTARRAETERHAALAGYLLDGDIGWAQLVERARAGGWKLPERCAPLLIRPASTSAIPWQLQKTLQNTLRDHLEGERVICVLKGSGASVLALVEGFSSALEIERRCGAYRDYFWEHFSVQLEMDACLEPVPLDTLPGLLAVAAKARENGEDSLRNPRRRPGADADILWVDALGSPADPVLSEWIAGLRGRVWTLFDAEWSLKAAKHVERLEGAAGPAAFGGELKALAAHYLRRAEAPDALAHAFAEFIEGGVSIRRMIEGFEADIAPHGKPFRPEIVKIIGHMLLHIDEALPLSSLAGLIYMHPQYLSNVFRKEAGVSFSDFLSMIRIEKAQRMLTGTRLSVLQVSSACGFSDTAYFCRLFKQKTGRTPGQWRRVPCES